MIPGHDMRRRLASMNNRSSDGTLRSRDHLLRAPLVVDPDDKAEVARVFNSGGAGMFAKPQEYCSEYPQNPGEIPSTNISLQRSLLCC